MHHMSIISGNPDGHHTFCGEADADSLGKWNGRILMDGHPDHDYNDTEDLAALEIEHGMGASIEPMALATAKRGREGSNDPIHRFEP